MSEESQKWFEELKESALDGDELVDLDNAEQDELYSLCKDAYDKSYDRLLKKNPSDAKWLQTALHKGTLRDRAGSGAMLFQSNPLPNLEALDVLIGLTKSANRANVDIIDIIGDLFTTSILPADRKLVSLQQRGAAFRKLKANTKLEKSYKEKVYLYWHFENELKDRYHTFLQNLESALKSAQDIHKNLAIVCTSKLLMHGPEKEQMLLSMLINKMGDPQAKVAAKAQYQLTEVGHKHPNMCEVMVQETDRFLFRPNLSERAQHVALTFLSEISPICNPKACRRLIQLCFLFFKILVDKGMVNNRTMQAILRCLRRAAANVEQKETDREIISKDLQDIIYRLINFADIQISIQALGLLMQVFVMPGQPTNPQKDRFYSALYRKMVDVRIAAMTQKWTAQYLYIIHRAIALDPDIVRAKAFIKRLLQMSLYLPAQNVCGVLIIVNKILVERPDIVRIKEVPTGAELDRLEARKKLLNEDSDEEHYDDVQDGGTGTEPEKVAESSKKKKKDKKNKSGTASWVHSKVIKTEDDGDVAKGNEVVKDRPRKEPKVVTKYDPYYRNPSGAGAQYEQILELIRVKQHFHPTVQKFIDFILQNKRIDYYGDPLVDFSLTRFLDRFAFKNPKTEKSGEEKKEIQSVVQNMHHKAKSYKQSGSRGMPVASLTDRNCTEDERFIFQYLERRRQLYGETKKSNDSDSENDDVDDDEFDAYLDGLGGSGSQKMSDVDYMKEINELPSTNAETKGKKRKKGDDDDEDGADNEDGKHDWDEANGDDDNDDGDNDSDISMDGEDFSDMSDLSEDGDDDDDDDQEVMTFSDEEDNDSDADSDAGKKKGNKKGLLSDREFNRKIKHSVDMSSMFAAADDFGELLEKTGKLKKHGTLDEVSNTDKSSEKQLNWEQNRLKKAGKSRKVATKPSMKNKSKKVKRK